jgi:hypothetical protein
MRQYGSSAVTPTVQGARAVQLFEVEIEDAKKRLAESGRARDSFTFDVTHLPPDPDAVAMFTARYEIEITNTKTGKSMGVTGGIGLSWVDDFADALAQGHFD